MIKIDAGDFCLIEPSEIYAEQIREYRQDFLDTNSSMDGCGPLRRCENPITYISECKKYTAPETLPKEFVIATQFFYVRKADNHLVGMIQVRHYFNDYLAKYGGHIGYSIRPSERRKGYATSMLNAVLPYCREIGLDKILITCIDGNMGSEKTILNNGGIYESTVYESGEKLSLKRFWITL
ncbi:MAG: GNAT family N-acetyltransferase [Eubacterium sp.]|nr:GNAT family N-acetyltransferase [Eubacterium sp.]MDE6155061.1 GNAT family N-acetyltransferase [Eubacterium sp.]MDE6767979.1 GNAT family N-acetyltransferase [Eubacterium sp.]